MIPFEDLFYLTWGIGMLIVGAYSLYNVSIATILGDLKISILNYILILVSIVIWPIGLYAWIVVLSGRDNDLQDDT